MAKTKYFAIDRDGWEHTRTSERLYTHTVVVRPGYLRALQDASAPGWDAGEAAKWEYYQQIAAGHDPNPIRPDTRSTSWAPPHLTALDIEQASLAKEKRMQEAKLIIDGKPRHVFILYQREQRLEAVELARKAGAYDRWINVGWCGRHALAVRLAKMEMDRGLEADILEAQVKL